jgi:hypothetical protein
MVLCLSGCRTGTPSTPQNDSTVVVLFPWPNALPAASTPRCIALENRVRDGLALEDDVWSAVTCVVDRLVTNKRASDVEKYLSEVRYFERTTTLFVVATHSQAAAAGVDLPPAAKGDVTLYATPAARAHHPSLASLDTPTLGSGSYRGLCMPWRRKPGFPGHYEVTRRVISAVRAKGIAVTDACEDLMSDASQDVDLFEWKEMAAHGQTADDSGLPSQPVDAAVGRWRDWIEKYTTKAGALCAAPGNPAQLNGIYLLGYSVHAIEDAASHRGRTNPEHAYNSLFESNPDKVAGVDDLATEMATDVLVASLQGKAKACAGLLGTLQPHVFSFPEKMVRFGFSWEGNPVELLDYEISAHAFAPHVNEPVSRVRWFGPQGDWPQRTSCEADAGCSGIEKSALDAVR